MIAVGIIGFLILIAPVLEAAGVGLSAVKVAYTVNDWRVKGCPERWFEDGKIHYRCKPTMVTK